MTIVYIYKDKYTISMLNGFSKKKKKSILNGGNEAKKKKCWQPSWQIDSKSLFGYHLFCWNWKLITENTIDKDKS